MTVIQFPGKTLSGPILEPIDPDYSVHIRITPGGLDWDVEQHTPEAASIDGIASDLAAIALSLRPQPRTFGERLKALIFGDDK